ncbi:MAG: hypothetical protein SOX77_05250 [Candidatus Borkfalkiaceae bacterium]|nr:hypothetical protein [Christensenellaceae bacterium]
MKSKKIVLAVLLSTFLAASAGFGVSGFKTVAAISESDVTFEAGEVKTSFIMGEELKVPQGKFVYGGKKYAADAVVRFPDGNAYLDDYVKLTQTGVYEIEYRAVIEGTLIKEKKSFETLEALYSVGSTRSSMRYGKPTELGLKFVDERSPSGLAVSLAKGDEFTYNGVIDLKNSSRDAKTLQLYVTPEREKAADAFSVMVKFTDIYDPNNYVMVSTWSYNMKCYNDSPCRAAYVTSCVPSIGQTYTGHYSTYQAAAGGWIDTVFKSMRTSGFCSFMSFYGDNAGGEFRWNDGTPGGSGFTLDWGYPGYQQLGFWWNYDGLELCGNQPTPEFSNIIADYDNPNYYSSLWDGFTTGECYVSLWAEQYNNTSFNFVVTEMAGVDLTTQAPATTYKDEAAPVISVNYGAYTETAYPDALVGSPYTVFKANAIDGYDGEKDVSVRAFYAYGTENCYEVSCDTTFTPDREGDYTLVYKAKDQAGNVAEKHVVIHAGTVAEELTLTVNESGAEKTGVKGRFITVAEATYGGGVGAITYTANAKGKKSGKQYEIENGSFRPMVADTYEISYAVTDFIGQQKTYKYEVAIADSAAPVFEELPALPKYLISGYEYTFPQAVAIDKKGNAVQAQIYFADGGSETLAAPTVSVGGDSRTAEVVYRAEAGGEIGELRFGIPVVNVKKGVSIDMAKYFAGENFTATSDSSNVVIAASGNRANAEFINAVLAEGFSAQYAVTSGEFNELAMYLTDSVNLKQKIKISWKNVAGVNWTYVNDKITTISSMFDFAGNASNFSWNNKLHTFNDATSSLSVEINETVYGEKFEGFTSGKLYFGLALDGVYGEAAVSVTKMNNQPIRLARRDVIDPQMSIIGDDYVTQARTGDTIDLKGAIVADVLSPVCSLSLTVTDPEGNSVKTIDGVTVENLCEIGGAVKLDKVGTYTVTYAYSDGSREVSEPFEIKCSLSNAIEITINGNVPEKATVGSEVKLPSATAIANGGNATVYVLVINPKGYITNVTSAMSFKAELKGTYRVIYTAYDSSDNVKTIYRDVVAE